MNTSAISGESSMESIEQRIQQIFASPVYDDIDQKEILISILSLIDLTSLEGTDNDGRILGLCKKALSYMEMGLPLPAAVCVYPPFIKIAKKELAGTGIRIASVAGAFPSGQSPLHLRIEEIKFAIEEGADEIDTVISRGKLLEGNESFVYDELSAIRDVAGKTTLKVILETGELNSLSNIRKASEIAISAGADFIKTSTGKISPAATESAVLIMLDAIRENYLKTGNKTGIKPAGGISESRQAVRYYIMVRNILGTDWLNSNLFRIGASRLADQLVSEIFL